MNQLFELAKNENDFFVGFKRELSNDEIDLRSDIRRWEEKQIKDLFEKTTEKQFSEVYKLIDFKYEKCYIFDQSKDYGKKINTHAKRKVCSYLENKTKFPVDYQTCRIIINSLCKSRNGVPLYGQAYSLMEEIVPDLDYYQGLNLSGFKWLFYGKENKKKTEEACRHLEEFNKQGKLQTISELIDQIKKLNKIDAKKDFEDNKDWYYSKLNGYSEHIAGQDDLLVSEEIDIERFKNTFKSARNKLSSLIKESEIKTGQSEGFEEQISFLVGELKRKNNTEVFETAEQVLLKTDFNFDDIPDIQLNPLSALLIDKGSAKKVIDNAKKLEEYTQYLLRQLDALKKEAENNNKLIETNEAYIALKDLNSSYIRNQRVCVNGIRRAYEDLLNKIADSYPSVYGGKIDFIDEFKFSLDEYNCDDLLVEKISHLRNHNLNAKRIMKELLSFDPDNKDTWVDAQDCFKPNNIPDWKNDFAENQQDYRDFLSKVIGKKVYVSGHKEEVPDFEKMGHLADVYKELRGSLDSAKTYNFDDKEQLGKVLNQYRKEKVQRVLRSLPVETLNRDKENIRVASLRKMGYCTISDIPESSEKNLVIFSGMSMEASKRVSKIVDTMHDEITVFGDVFLSTDHPDDEIRKACRKLYKVLNIDKTIRSLSRRLSEIDKRKEYLKILSDPFTWFASVPADRDDALKEQDVLSEKIMIAKEDLNSETRDPRKIQSFLFENRERVLKLLAGITDGNYTVLNPDFGNADIEKIEHFEKDLLVSVLSSKREDRRSKWDALDLYEYSKLFENDFYFQDDLDDIAASRLDPMNGDEFQELLSLLGFHKNAAGGYHLRNYENLSEYLYDDAQKLEIISLEGYKKKYRGNYLVDQVFDTLKKDFKIFEFEEGQFITIKRLNKLNIDHQDIWNYLDRVESLQEDSFFNHSSLKKDMDDVKICGLGFSGYFYDQIIKSSEEYQYLNLYSGIVFAKGMQEMNRQVFIQGILKRYGSMYLDDFIDFVNDRFDLNLTKNYLLSDIKGSEIHYDKIMDKIYENYDLYYEDI